MVCFACPSSPSRMLVSRNSIPSRVCTCVTTPRRYADSDTDGGNAKLKGQIRHYPSSHFECLVNIRRYRCKFPRHHEALYGSTGILRHDGRPCVCLGLYGIMLLGGHAFFAISFAHRAHQMGEVRRNQTILFLTPAEAGSKVATRRFQGAFLS